MRNSIEYNGRYYLEEDTIKDILQREFTRHTQEMEQHRKQFEENDSKKQKEKYVKHMHKRYQTGCIAKLMGFKICESCRGIY